MFCVFLCAKEKQNFKRFLKKCFSICTIFNIRTFKKIVSKLFFKHQQQNFFLFYYIYFFHSRYYGMSIWFPEYMKRLEQEVYFKQTNHTDNEIIRNRVYTDLLDNIYYSNTTFINITFSHIELRHVNFDQCLLDRCKFIKATAKQTYFIDSIVTDSMFNNTNFSPLKFQNTFLDNKTRHSFFGMVPECTVDFEISYSQRHVFLETFISQVVVIPVAIVNALLLDKIGRVRLLGKYIIIVSVIFFSNICIMYFILS